MKDSKHKQHFSSEIESDDDIDKLFSRLRQLEPPPSLISHILSNIRQLPPPKQDDELDGLVIRNEHKGPC